MGAYCASNCGLCNDDMAEIKTQEISNNYAPIAIDQVNNSHRSRQNNQGVNEQANFEGIDIGDKLYDQSQSLNMI